RSWSLTTGVAEDVAHQQWHRPAGRALLAAAAPGGAGDIEMSPAQITRKAREEGRGGDRAARPSAHIGEVGEVGTQLLLVILPQRQLPDAVPRVVRGLAHLVGELLVVGEQAARDMPERDD